MGWRRDPYGLLARLLGREARRRDVEDEMGFHVDQLIRRLRDEGLTEDEARAEATRRFGDRARYAEETVAQDQAADRARAWRERLGSALREWRIAVRTLRRNPGFFVFSLVPLTLAFTGLTATMALVEQALIRPLPYADADQLVVVRHPVPGLEEGTAWNLSQAGYHFFRGESRALAELGVWVGSSVNLAAAEGVERAPAVRVSASLLDVLGVVPTLGRGFTEADNGRGAPSVALLDHRVWRDRFGSDPTIVGRTLRVDAEPVEIVGILPAGFEHPLMDAQVWLPLTLDPNARPVNAHFYRAIGRVRSAILPESAQTELAGFIPSLPDRFPEAYSQGFLDRYRFGLEVIPLREAVMGSLARTLWILLLPAFAVLAVTLLNVLGLFALRWEARRREVAVRQVVGARRGHLAWNALAETLTLTLPAALFAGIGVQTILRFLPAHVERALPSLVEVAAGPWTWGLLAALLVGATWILAWPGVLTGSTLAPGLREREGTPSRARRRVREVLVISQVALALVLATSAGLLLRTVANLRAVPLGFDATDVTVARLSFPIVRYQDHDAVWSFSETLRRSLETLPGLVSVGVTTRRPFSGADGCSLVFVENRPLGPDERPPCVATPMSSPGYLEALDVPVTGRMPRWSDATSGEVVVSRSLAERFWPGRDPIGQGIRGNGDEAPFYRVVGVAGDVRADGFRQDVEDAVYFPIRPLEGAPLWGPWRTLDLVVESRAGAPVLGPLQRAVTAADPEVALADVTPMSVALSRTMARETLATALVGASAVLALLLSALGLYGVLAYTVRLRRREIGVRLALGATARQVRRRVLGHSVFLGVCGLIVGGVLAMLGARLLRSFLFGVAPWDPVTLVTVVGAMAGTVLLAGWLPARRASSVDPVEALRSE